MKFKERLAEMGLTEEQALEIMKELDGNFIPKSRFNEMNVELRQAREQLKERDGQLENLKKASGDLETLQTQIGTLQKENREKDEAHAAEIRQIRLDAAVDKALTDAKARNPKAVKALLDLTDAELAEDGSVQGLDAKVKALMDAEDSRFLFDREEKQPAKPRGFVPGEKKDGIPGISSEYEARLMEARKNGNTLEAIRIKQQAASEDVILI